MSNKKNSNKKNSKNHSSTNSNNNNDLKNDIGENILFKFPRTAHIFDIGGHIGLCLFKLYIFLKKILQTFSCF